MGRERTSDPFQFESMQNLIDSIKYHSRPLSESDILLLKIVATCNACKSRFAAAADPQTRLGPRWSRRHSLIVVVVIIIVIVGTYLAGLGIDRESGRLSV